MVETAEASSGGKKDGKRPPVSPLKLGRRGAIHQIGTSGKSRPEPEYEEVGPPASLRIKGNNPAAPDNRGDGRHCDLCGSAEAAVRCERCSNQAFCLSCDDMYHRHPRRSSHFRKAVEAHPGGVRPPLPPKTDTQTPPPQPPPRKNKRSGFLSSGTFARKDSASSGAGRSLMEKVGSLKRFMGGRPLPPTPDQNREDLTAKSSGPIIKTTEPEPNNEIEESLSLPQSVLELNTSVAPIMPLPRPASADGSKEPSTGQAPAQTSNPRLQPQGRQPYPGAPMRKFSLQQPAMTLDDKRTSLVEATPGTAGWEQEANKMTPRMRSQSISDDQWAQVMASQAAPFTSAHTHHTHTSSDMSGFATTRRGFNNSSGRLGGNLGRGMVSSASVCDLNALSQQQQHPHFNNSGVNSANSFQQLNLMNYGGGMMWPPCELCQGAPMYPGHHGGGNMKRTASNLSMNVSSVGSDLTGYPWPPHVHHHMPMYPGYYPGYHPHMVPMSMQGSSVGLNMSIPDSMHTFGKVPSSPAPSLRSSSHRSNKSSKSRSFSTADLSRRTRSRNKRRSDSEESQSSSGSENDEEDDGGKPGGYPRGNLPWQCEHCTFINSASARSCGMCSKSMGGTNGGEKSRWSRRSSEKRRSERRRDRRTDHEDDVQDISDYDNDGGVVKSNLSFNIKDSRKDSRSKITSSSKSSSKNKKKSRRRSSSASPSGSGSGHEDEDIHRVEKHMRDMRISSRSRTGDYDGVTRDRERNRDKDRNRDRSARKKEGRNRFKNRGHHPQERSRTPARQTPQRSSPVEGSSSPSPEQNVLPKEKSGSDSSKQEDQNLENPEDSGEDQTMVDKVPSENTVKEDEPLILQSPRHKSPVVSLRPASPEQIVEDAPPLHEEEPKDEEEEEVPVQIRVEEAFDVPQYIQRRSASPKLVSRSPSPSKGDENSLANTLDEIETMGTNEVADFEITAPFDDIPIVDPRQHILTDTPVMAYIPQPSPEPAAFDAFVPEPEVKEDFAPAEVGDRDFWFEIAKDKPRSHSSDVINDEKEEHLSESSEKDEESVVHEEPREPRYEPIEDTGYIQKEQTIDAPATWGNEVETNEGADDGTLKLNYTEETPKEEISGEVIESREVARSTSSGSSAGRGSGRHERQCTPLSYSSSDAQFYSPPDSPDLSLSDKLTDQGIICKVDLEGDLGLGSYRPSTCSTEGFYERLTFEDAAETASTTDLSDEEKGPDEEKQEFPIYAKISKLKKEAERKARCVVEDSGDASEKYMTVEEIITKRKQETMRKQGLEIVQTLREAEEMGYNAEEVSIALTLCGDKSPLQWLQDNWRHMVDTVLTLATNYGHERQSSDIGSITAAEARSCLRLHRGNIWAAVTESVDQRQQEINEINSRGNFKHEDIVRTLEQYDGNADLAFRDLNKKKLAAETLRRSRQPVAEPVPEEDRTSDKNSLPSQEDLIQEIIDLSRGDDDYDFLDVTYVGLSDSSDDYLNASGAPQERGQEDIFDASDGPGVWSNLEGSQEDPDRVSEPQEAYDDEPAVEDMVASPDHHTTYDYLTALDYTTDADADEEVAKHTEAHQEEEEEEEEDQNEEEAIASDSEDAAELQQLTAESPGPAADDAFRREHHELQLVRKEDVVVHPFRAYTHYADLSVSEFSDDLSPFPDWNCQQPVHCSYDDDDDLVARGGTSRPDQGAPPVSAVDERSTLPLAAHDPPNEVVTTSGCLVDSVTPQAESAGAVPEPPQCEPSLPIRLSPSVAAMACSTTSGSAAGSLRSSFSSYYSANMPESSDKLPSSSFESLHSSTQSDHNTGFSTPEDAGPPWHVQQGLEAKTRTLSLDESNGANDDDDDEEEPVSVTMGRLSLSLTPSSHEAKVDVKSETMENSNTEEANVRWSSGTEETGGISEDSNITYESGMTTTTATTTSESVQKPTEDEIQAANARARPGTGPVTVQKATVIVGKAIAKAMAREHDVRTSSRLSETPEPPSLDTTEESIEPPSATPEPSEDEDITTHVTSSVTVSESEDDDHLRTLDTIPEEEEISERTESGRTRSRASFKNLVLPFDPNNVVELKPIPQPVRDVPIPRGWSKPTIEKTATSTEMNVNRGKDAGVKTKAESQPGRPEIDYVNEPMQRYVNVDSTANDNASSPEVIPQDYESISEVKREVDDSKFKKSEMTSKITHLVTPSPSKTKGEKSPVDVTTDTKKTQVGAGKKQRGRNKQGWDEATTSDISDGTYAKTTINSRSAGAYSTMTETSTVSAPASKSSKSESSGSSTDTKTTTNLAEAKAEAVKEDDTTEEISEEVSQTPSEVETTTTKSEASDKGGKENATKKQGIKSGGKTKGKGKKKGKAATKDQKASADSKRTQDDKETSENKNATNTDQEKPTPTTPTTPSTSASTTVSKNTVTQNVTLPDPSPPASTTAITSNRMGIKSSSRKLTSLIKKRSTSLDSSEDSGEDFNDQAQPETTGISPATQEVPELLVQEPTKEPENEDTRRQYEQLKFDRTVRRLLAEGHTGSYEKAELATHLMSLDFEETMSITAAEECSSIYTALQFLQQECELCAEKYPMGKMVSMLHCIHRCCHDCAKTYFTFQIKTKNIREVRCPFCSEPDLDASEEIATEYFNNLDILLKNILDSGTHELFQRKLRDWTLMKDPNFRWCNKCSSGFIANPMARKLYCPDCRDVTCAQCRLPWESAHDGISCEEFAAWKADNNVEVSEATVSKHLAECGITCPNCKFTYSLAKGGCMHFTCIQCKFEFCSGCGQPFMQGARCPVGPYCERLGLHAHHPRNCLFYLRDKEPYQLQRLLKDAGIEFDIDSKEEKTICQVQEQKELPEGLIDDICGRVVPKGYAGLCRLHYTEYLVEKINGSRLDPVSIFDEADLRVCLRRNGKTVPVRRWESEKGYRDKLIKLIKEQLPLQ